MKKNICILIAFVLGWTTIGFAETMVYLEHCETLSFDQDRIPDAQILKGNVVFRHDSALMYCDSAYFYEKTNSLDAFGHVRFVQGDTLQGSGDVLYYNGNTKFARLRKHVKLVHFKTTLVTDSLNYDRVKDIAWYYTGGTLQDSLNTLTSVWGQYTPYDNQALFKTTVHLVNEKFTLDADTLKYNTNTNIADLVGPTQIVYEEETNIYSTKGWYNTDNEKSMLLDRSTVEHNDGKSLVGDTIFYDKANGFGQALGHVEMKDTANQATLYGNYGEAYEKEEKGFATDSALLIDWSSDDWMYMHADTLFTDQIYDTIFSLVPKDSILIDSVMHWQAPDTIWIDTTYRRVRAYHNVRVYRSDVQMVCDSLSYSAQDSIMTLYHKPICWQDGMQMSADQIMIYMKDSTVDHIVGTGDALAVDQDDETHFNQMAGKEMTAFVVDKEIRQLNVDGNAETVFFPREEDGDEELIGVNRTQSSYVKLFFKDEKIDHIVFTTKTTGTMYPIEQATAEKMHLSCFFWAEAQRPKKPGDVFENPSEVERPEQKALSAADDEMDEETKAKLEKERKREERKNHKRREK